MIKYTNNFGGHIKVLEDGNWLIEFYRSEVNKAKVKVKWGRIPKEWLNFWMDVCKSIFEKNQPDSANSVVVAASNFHEWIEYYQKEISDFNELTELDFSLFHEYLDKKMKIKRTSRRGTFTFLIKGFEEAMLLDKDIEGTTINRLKAVRLVKFKKINDEIHEQNSKKVLMIEQLEKVQEALIQEFHLCQDVLKNKNEDNVHSKPDMFVIVAIWMAMKHGLRTTELLNLTTESIQPDEKNGHHKLECVGGAAKPDRIIEINQSALDILNFFVNWSSEARKKLNTNAFCIEMEEDKNGEHQAKFIANYEVNDKIKKFIKKYDLYDEDGEPFDMDLQNLRRTYGAIITAHTDNKEVARQVLGHTDVQTTERHYTSQNKANLSQYVAKALRSFALELAMTYKKPVVELKAEMPHIAKLLEDEPERDYKYGVCHVTKIENTIAASCKRAANCLECSHLIPESRKLHNYKAEREIWMKRAGEAKDDRVKQQRLRRVQMLDAYIYLIEDAVEKWNMKKEEGKQKRSYYKKTYKKRKE